MTEDLHAPVFVISVAAELADMHPQTLRQYDRLGLVSPRRAPGRSRRYSRRDVELLREVQRLSQSGVSLAGIKRILELEARNVVLEAQVKALIAELAQRSEDREARVFAAGAAGDIVRLARGERPRSRSQAVVVWKPRR